MISVNHKHILILSDIEGSSNCHNYEASRFLGKGWPKACQGMTRDVNAVVSALFKAGVEKIVVKDFHRTGYNLFKSGIDQRARLISGYFKGPVPGMGSIHATTGLVMLGMHAPSGSTGFLAHTLTSRILELKVNGDPMSEAQLFAGALAPYNLIPLFFSGCPIACKQAGRVLDPITCFPIKKKDKQNEKARIRWRRTLGLHAVNALSNHLSTPYDPMGPFHAAIRFNAPVKKIKAMASDWGYRHDGHSIFMESGTIDELYRSLLHLVYFTPLTLKLLPFVLPAYHLMGRTGLALAKRQLFKQPG